MPDAPAATGKKSGTAFLKEKAGPLPIWVWLVILGGIVYYIRSKQSGSSLFGGTGSATPNLQKDPAGNIGTIDPATGYVYGTPEDNAALAANNAGVSGPGGASGGTVAGSYTNDADWGRAAINYLVGLGVDPTQANEAIQQFLSGQQLTSQQQSDVNLAIQSLGAPPQPPGPVGTPPGQVVTPPGGTGAGTCPSGYTYSATKTNATGEVAATGGTGWCELASTTPPPVQSVPSQPGNATPPGAQFYPAGTPTGPLPNGQFGYPNEFSPGYTVSYTRGGTTVTPAPGATPTGS